MASRRKVKLTLEGHKKLGDDLYEIRKLIFALKIPGAPAYVRDRLRKMGKLVDDVRSKMEDVMFGDRVEGANIDVYYGKEKEYEGGEAI